MNYEYYEAAHRVTHNLRQQGESQWAERIDDAIESGATGTEIFMALRWQLQQLRNANLECHSETELLIDELLRELNKALS